MPSIKIKDTEYFDVGLRKFKRACEKAGIPGQLRSKERYEKPTTRRKRKKAAAVKRYRKKIQKEQELLEPILQKARNAINEVAEEGKYTYIFDKSMGTLLYAEDSENIISKVKKKLGL